MKLKISKDFLKTLDKKDWEMLFDDYQPREERHYCALLFAWLIQNPGNVKTLLEKINPEFAQDVEIGISGNVKLYFEFTWLRDLLYEYGRSENWKDERKKLVKNLNKFVFKERIAKAEEKAKKTGKKVESVGDIQKKKPDLAIYLMNSKKLILIEAKFEEGFDPDQINETKKYGDALVKLLSPEFVTESHVVLLGRRHYINKYIKDKGTAYYTIIWEDLVENNKDFRFLEINKGLKNQKRIHPKT